MTLLSTALELVACGYGGSGGLKHPYSLEQQRGPDVRVSSRGSPAPPASDRISGVVMFRRPGSVPPQISPVPANAAAADPVGDPACRQRTNEGSDQQDA